MGRGRRKRTNDDDDNGFAAWGGYMAAKKSKLMEQFSEAVESNDNRLSNIFKGVSIFVNGYTKPSSDELKNLMSLHGGVFHHYHIPIRTTHIIASNLPDTKIKQLGWNSKIVKPDWIVASIKANRLLDYSSFLLYTNQNRLQPKLNFTKIIKDESTSFLPNISENINSLSKLEDEKQNTEIFDEPLSPDMFSSFEEDSLQNKMKENHKEQDFNEKESIDKERSSNQDTLTEKSKDSIKDVNKDSNENTYTCMPPPSESKGKSGRTLTANDPKFLSEFYNNSRLHHIATLGATFKQHICNLREQSNWKFPERDKLRQHVLNLKEKNGLLNEQIISKNRVIMHIDMDCFFVSVGLRSYPELKGHPVAVTHSKGGQEPTARSGVNRQAEIECYRQRMQDKLKTKSENQLGPGNMLVRLESVENSSMSEIASCSYEARQAGVKNGMFMGAALKLSPNLKTIPYDFEGYKEVANTLYNTIAEYTLNIEAVSCDEMFVDISEVLQDTGATVEQWATYIRSLINDRTRCPCSAGFGANRLQARMATRTAKPCGQFHLLPDNVEEYMVEIKVNDLPGVGRSTTLKLNSMNVKTCGDLQLMSLSQLQSEFGTKIGETLFQHSRGIDERPLVYEHERKSVSAEINYGIRFKDNVEAEIFLKQLCGEVHSRLTEVKMKGKCITLKLMVKSKDAPAESSKFMGHGVCDYITKSTTLSSATMELEIISREITAISNKLNVPPSDLRGIGIQISRLEKLNKPGKSKFLTNFLNSTDTSKIIINKKESQVLKDSNISSKPLNSTENVNSKIIKNVEISTKLENINNALNSKSTEEKKTLKDMFNSMTKPSTSRNTQMPDLSLSPVSEVANYIAKTEVVNTNSNDREISNNVVQNTTKIVKKRGRPKGSTKKNTIKNKPNNGIQLNGFLKQQNNTEKIQRAITSLNIDMDVLAALPDDIQQEILKEYQLQKTTHGFIKSPIKNTVIETNTILPNKAEIIMPNKTDTSPQKTSIIHSKVNEKTPQKIGEEFDKIYLQNEDSNSNASSDVSQTMVQQPMFLGMNLSEVRQLLRVWVSSELTPESCDIFMLADYFKKLALDSKIEDLFVMLKFLYNEIATQNNCNWHIAYHEIVKITQQGMVAKYGSTIYVHKDFQCDKNCHILKS